MIIKLGKVISEYSVRNKADEDIPVYSVTNDKGFCTNYFSKDVSSKDRTTYKIVPYGYFAYNPSRINVGSVDWQHYEKKVIVSPLYVVFYVDEVIDQRYLLHYLKSDITLKFIKSNSAGSVRDNLKLSVLQEFSINLRTKEEQYKIVNILDKVDLLISLYTEKLKKFDELTKSLFIEMFGDPIYNSKNWQVVQIGDIATDVRYGTSNPAVEGGKYPYLRMNNITVDGKLDLRDLKYIDISDYEIERYVVRKGDLLFNRTNSIELVGKTTTFDLNEDMIIAGYIIRVRLNNQMLPEVLSQYMNLEVIKSKLRDMAKGAVNQANINAQELQSIRVYLPDIDIQKKFVKTKCKLDKSKLAVKKSLEELEILKKSLMQKYFA